jgi:hypothetical protein
MLEPIAEMIAVLTPISRPAESRSGPPEFLGLMAAQKRVGVLAKLREISVDY